MSIGFIVVELGRTLRHEIGRACATHPKTSAAAALVAGLVAVVVGWSVISSLLWPPQRNLYGSVSGTVTSVSGTPVADALVLFVNDAAGAGASGRTDASGHFTAQGIRAGRYVVAIQPVIEPSNGELSKDQVVAARSRLETSVPLRFQDASTSGLTADLVLGRNRYDIDLRSPR
jgi:hypothetical protein